MNSKLTNPYKRVYFKSYSDGVIHLQEDPQGNLALFIGENGINLEWVLSKNRDIKENI